eukprot:9279979-Pyramimonas_sp.AAC.1
MRALISGIVDQKLDHNKIKIEDYSGDAEVLTTWAGGCNGKIWSEKLKPDVKNALVATKARCDKTLWNIPAKML